MHGFVSIAAGHAFGLRVKGSQMVRRCEIKGA